jgi:hypothetical protein
MWFIDGVNGKVKSQKRRYQSSLCSGLIAEKSPKQARFLQDFWSGEQDLNLRQLGDCGLGRLE